MYLWSQCKIPASLFVAINKPIIKFYVELELTQNCQDIFIKNNKVFSLLPGFKACHKATEIKTVWYWLKDGHRDQQDRTEFKNRLRNILSDFSQMCKGNSKEKDDLFDTGTTAYPYIMKKKKDERRKKLSILSSPRRVFRTKNG